MKYAMLVLLMITIDSSLIGMEKESKKNRTLKKSSKYAYLETLPEISSLEFNNQQLEKNNSMIRRMKQFLYFLEFVLTIKQEESHSLPLEVIEQRLIQFDLLNYLYSKYVYYSMLENQENECIDEYKNYELKLRIQDKGTLAYFDRGLLYKNKAEKKYTIFEKKELWKKKSKALKRVLHYAKLAHKDFIQAYKIDTSNEESKKLSKELDSFIDMVQYKLECSYSYIKGLEKTKKVFAQTPRANGQISSARDKFERYEQQFLSDAQTNVPTRPKRNKTFSTLKRKIKQKKKGRRRSLPDLEHYLQEQDKVTKEECIKEGDKAINLGLKRVKGFSEVLEIYKSSTVLQKAQMLLKEISDLESKRSQIDEKTPWKREIQALCEKLATVTEMMNNEEHLSSSSSSD